MLAMKQIGKICVFMAAMALSIVAMARTIEVPSLPPSIYLDSEVSTNIAMHVNRHDTRNFSMHLQLEGAPSNALEIAFGCDADMNGLLESDEVETVYGWRGGRYVIENAKEWDRLESDSDSTNATQTLDIQISNDSCLSPRVFSVKCGDMPAFDSLADNSPPSWLFRASWDTVRVTRRGVGTPSDWVRCDIEYQSFAIHVR